MSSAIVLLGYMGCGKTKVGKKLSKKIGAKFFDLDAEIELYQSKPISQIFDEIGEIGFRKIERKVLIKLLNKNDFFVLSLGGGTPCYALQRNSNRENCGVREGHHTHGGI